MTSASAPPHAKKDSAPRSRGSCSCRRNRRRALLPPSSTTLLLAATCAAALVFVARAQQQQSYFAGGKLSDASAALRLHNTFRALHVAQPLSWDPNLAQQAQSWADGCKWRHAEASRGEKPRDQGENMYFSVRYSSSESGSRAVKAWYREVADVDWRASMDRRAREPGRIVGHATQLLWRSTARVGCGHGRCSRLEGSPVGGGQSDGALVDFIVCRYWPTGNYVGRMENEVLPGKIGGPDVAGKKRRRLASSASVEEEEGVAQ